MFFLTSPFIELLRQWATRSGSLRTDGSYILSRQRTPSIVAGLVVTARGKRIRERPKL